MNPSPPQSPVLSTNLDDPEAIPYFLWDEPMSVRELFNEGIDQVYPHAQIAYPKNSPYITITAAITQRAARDS